MSAITVNPPLPYTKTAIRDHLRHHATNGPAYVQIQATKALARIIGLYDEAKQGIQSAAEHAVQETKSKFHGLKFEGFGAYNKNRNNQEEDEEAANQEDDDVP